MKKEKLFTITEAQLEMIIKLVIDKMYAKFQGEAGAAKDGENERIL